jgi:hypothetical protein
MSEPVILWHGKPVEELTHEELLQAFAWTVHEVELLRAEHERIRPFVDWIGVVKSPGKR